MTALGVDDLLKAGPKARACTCNLLLVHDRPSASYLALKTVFTDDKLFINLLPKNAPCKEFGRI